MIGRKKRFSIFSLISRLLMCGIFITAVTYVFIDKQNHITELRRRIPEIKKVLRNVIDSNKKLKYQIDRFESPLNLMEISKRPEFSHLRYPAENEVITIIRKGAVDEQS